MQPEPFTKGRAREVTLAMYAISALRFQKPFDVAKDRGEREQVRVRADPPLLFRNREYPFQKCAGPGVARCRCSNAIPRPVAYHNFSTIPLRKPLTRN